MLRPPYRIRTATLSICSPKVQNSPLAANRRPLHRSAIVPGPASFFAFRQIPRSRYDISLTSQQRFHQPPIILWAVFEIRVLNDCEPPACCYQPCLQRLAFLFDSGRMQQFDSLNMNLHFENTERPLSRHPIHSDNLLLRSYRRCSHLRQQLIDHLNLLVVANGDRGPSTVDSANRHSWPVLSGRSVVRISSGRRQVTIR